MPATSANRLLIGGALLAFWLGWTAAALAWLQPARFATGNAADLEPLLAQVLQRLPANADNGPLAVRLQPACACESGSEPAWQALVAELQARGGTSLVLEGVAQAGAPEVLILTAHQQPVYAGPLVPDPALCGSGAPATRLRQWLPQLLARQGTPLLANAACSCSPPHTQPLLRLPA